MKYLLALVLMLVSCSAGPLPAESYDGGFSELLPEGIGAGIPLCLSDRHLETLAFADTSPYATEPYTSRACVPLSPATYGMSWCCPNSVCDAPRIDHRLSSTDRSVQSVNYWTSSGCTAPSSSTYYGLVWCCLPACIPPKKEHRLASVDTNVNTVDSYVTAGCDQPNPSSLFGLVWCCR